MDVHDFSKQLIHVYTIKVEPKKYHHEGKENSQQEQLCFHIYNKEIIVILTRYIV